MTLFFYDSYAIIEYINGNPRFKQYFGTQKGVLTLLNVLEIYYAVLRGLGKEKADIALETTHQLIVEPDKETIQRAMMFRLAHKEKDLSYADCLGYQTAIDKGLRFLTGDNMFAGMSNVEFVK